MRLLLVEDSEALRRPVVKALKASGFAVDATGDGQEGLWMALEHDYDVIILDIMLPGLDGREVLKKLREANNETPVLFLTAKDSIEDRVAGLRLGADDYLVKSFAIEELIARVEALARRKYQHRSPKLVVADLVLDRSAKTVKRAEQAIALPSQLYALLELLMLHTDSVISRTQIEHHIYDEQVSPTSNVVDTAICALRKAISVSTSSAPLIHTRRGMGYMISPKKP
ncbi:response regulator transcription factor [Shewanella goraebulensis]|uniref:response regulator transcription factor n=1 Tax=Shewanella goraebulensis TaxID=3050637 RepID=UPI00255173A6|nr:response regulator transcription factor [Shewanella goraebulensis]